MAVQSSNDRETSTLGDRSEPDADRALAAEIAELRRANAVLAASNDRYARLYDHAPIAHFTLGEGGVVLDANAAGAALLGLPRDVVRGRSFDDIVVAESRASFHAFRASIVEDAPGGHDSVLRTTRGSTPVRIEASLVTDQTTAAEQYTLYIIDDTERVAEANAADARRVESLRVLAAGVAHDFNNILAIVASYTDLILLEDDLTAEAHGYARAILEASARAAVLSHQMLAYSGKAPHRMELLDLSVLVRAGLNELTLLVRHGSLRFDLAEALPPVRGDAVQIEQIVRSLVANAADAISSGGSVLIRTRASDSNQVVLEVADDGRGMDEATRSRAFEPFFSTKFAGRGLGLAVVQGQAQMHGATISVESRPHHGSSFRVAFDAASAPRRDGVVEARAEAPVVDNGVVLVVDDEDGIRVALKRLIERMGFTVCTAEDGIDALAVAAAAGPALVAILLDLTMPRLDGPATLVRLRERSQVPVLLMSGFANGEITADVIRLADGFLLKPFTAEVLRSELTRAIATPRGRSPGAG